MEPQIKITKINNRYHARLMEGDVIRDEMACENRLDVGLISREMLRWFVPGGKVVLFSSPSIYHPKGQIWYKNQLDK
jgi:hypothetical protein